jgi:hypothetical protein
VQTFGNEIFKEQKLTIGLDLGDRWSFYCVLDEAGEIILEQKVATTPEKMKQTFEKIPRSLIALETGTHSPWISGDERNRHCSSYASGRLRPGLPAELYHVVEKCLEKGPARRPAHASEVADALHLLSTSSLRVAVPRGDGRRAVAVVPFQFQTAATEQRFLSVALADAVANRLGAAPTLVVTLPAP